jgi:hypothetical protein
MLNAVHPKLEGPQTYDGTLLRMIAREWMDDVHEFCNLDHYRPRVDSTPSLAAGADFGWRVRRFRARERWLAGNLQGEDRVSYDHPSEGTIFLFGYRCRSPQVDTADGTLPLESVAPDTQYPELVLFANLEGAPRTIIPADEIGARFGIEPAGWHRILANPSLGEAGTDPMSELTLSNGAAVLYGRKQRG